MNGIAFDNVHSYKDLNLVLSKVDIPPAAPKTTFVNIPGGDGSVDLTEALGETRYKNRECSFTFTVFPSDNFEEKKRQVSNLLNGRRFKIILDKDPGYFWDGRCSVNSYASNRKINTIVVKATVSPYKLKTNLTNTIVPSGNKVVRLLPNGRKTVVPTITNTADAIIVFGDTTYDINPGTHKLLGIELVEGGNEVTVTSTADVKFTYQEGDL